jgi:hypothetical protein
VKWFLRRGRISAASGEDLGPVAQLSCLGARLRELGEESLRRRALLAKLVPRGDEAERQVLEGLAMKAETRSPIPTSLAAFM